MGKRLRSRRFRSSEEVTLGEVDTGGGKHAPLLGCLDTFGAQQSTGGDGEVHHRADHRSVTRLEVDVPDDRDVQLDDLRL